jgi:PAS domain S-box-containing protein
MGDCLFRKSRAREELAAQAKRQEALSEIADLALRATDGSTLIRGTLPILVHGLQHGRVFFFEYSADSTALILREGSGVREKYLGRYRLELAENSLPAFLSTNPGAVAVTNLQQEDRFEVPGILREHRIASFIACEVPGKSRPHGVLIAGSKATRAFFSFDTSYLRTTAAMIGNALDRIRKETSMRDFREQALAIADMSTTGVIVIDEDSRIVYVNSATSSIFGYSRSELMGMQLSRLMPERFRSKHGASFRSYLLTGQKHVNWSGLELIGLHQSGKEINLEISFSEFHREGRRAFTGLVRDISDRKSRDQELRFMKFSIDQAADAAFWVGSEAEFVYVNEAACTSLGYTREELLGMRLHDIDPIFSIDVWPARWEMTRTGKAFKFESLHKTKDGRLIPVEITSNYLEFEGKGYACAFARDISERKRVEAALRSSEERYRVLFENANDIVFTLDLDGNLTTVNKAAEKITGLRRDELLKLNAGELVIQDPQTPSRTTIEGELLNQGRASFEVRVSAASGSSVTLEVSTRLMYRDGRPIGVQGIARDISERKNLQDQLRQAQKMEAVGRLAGGVAHDFNNLLTVIHGYSDVILESLEPGSLLRRDVEQIKRTISRGSELTNQLLAFSRRQVLLPRVIDLNDVVREMDKMLRRIIEEDIELVTLLEPQLLKLKVDPGQMEQVIVNLVINARDAMPEGGRLTIETSNVLLTDEYVRSHLSIPAGPYVALSVSDTGVGMEAEVLSHIFEPFFTTKEVGKGTGLGLSTVYGIVKQSGGDIEVKSEPGKGTCFRIYLLGSQESAVRAEQPLSGASPRGNETILLAEDEDAVRNLVGSSLRRKGYTVLEAIDGIDALDICNRHDGAIDLLLTDVVMPRMGGRELADRVCEIRPSIRVLFVSGYTDGAVVLPGLPHSDSASFLQKPFTTELLARRVREILDAQHQDL